MDRREFIKKSAITTTAVAGGVALASTANTLKVDASDFGVKKLTGKTIYDLYETNEELGPFPLENEIYSRGFAGDFPGDWFNGYLDGTSMTGEPSNSALDWAIENGAGISIGNKELFDIFRPGKPIGPEGTPTYKFKSKKEASDIIKKVAMIYDVSSVGIAPYDEKQMYDTGIAEFKELNFKPKSVIVIARLMDHELLKLSPQFFAGVTETLEYSRLSEIGGKISQCLSNLGYSSYSSCNDHGLRVPYAISAGIGEASRMGLIIHPTYGPGIRLGLIFTELELEYDSPIEFGAAEFCKKCMKCADECPSDAISKGDKTFEVYNKSNRKGIKKWNNNPEKCYGYWNETGIACSRCITTCPYFKLDTWHHRVAKIAANTPVINNVARYMDDMFGYGKYPNERDYHDYWKNVKIK